MLAKLAFPKTRQQKLSNKPLMTSVAGAVIAHVTLVSDRQILTEILVSDRQILTEIRIYEHFIL